MITFHIGNICKNIFSKNIIISDNILMNSRASNSHFKKLPSRTIWLRWVKRILKAINGWPIQWIRFWCLGSHLGWYYIIMNSSASVPPSTNSTKCWKLFRQFETLHLWQILTSPSLTKSKTADKQTTKQINKETHKQTTFLGKKKINKQQNSIPYLHAPNAV